MRAGVMLLLVLTSAPSSSAWARVSLDDAARLKTVLTPTGAEKAGNVEGTIPAWSGGLTTAPPCYQGAPNRLCDAFPDDKPLFVITAENVGRFKDRLCDGQLAMFRTYPDTYRLNIYRTRRTAAYPDFVNQATYKNALNAELTSGGEGVAHAILGVPFPIPKTGVEVVWNHKLRYRGPGLRRWNEQVAVTTGGDYNLVKLREDVRFAYGIRGSTPESLNNVIIDFLQLTVQPPRLAGQITLVHETMDQVREPRRAWQYNPGQRRMHRAPNVGYDNPVLGADGLRTYDQTDAFNGANDRYSWRILGEREVFIPYNAYRLHSDRYKIRDIIHKGHINQELPRYELHRVWVVEGKVRPNTSHIYARRVFYLDEDSWQISLADLYDKRGDLWRWQEAHTLQVYDQTFPTSVLETIYDLMSRRYLVQAMNNEDEETVVRDFDAAYFDPANVQKQTVK